MARTHTRRSARVLLMVALVALAGTADANGQSIRIASIQGRSHVSPMLDNLVVNVTGVVTSVRATGFFMQDPQPDDDPDTSEALYVRTPAAPTVQVGDQVQVDGSVAEVRSGGFLELNNLSTTTIRASRVQLLASGVALPPAVLIGVDGRQPPDRVIDDDSDGDIERSTTFDPANDGADFFESLEGMRVQVDDAIAIAPGTQVNELVVLADGGAGSTTLSPRGTLPVSAGDNNPERIIVDTSLVTAPITLSAGDRFSGPLAGLIDYAHGSFRLQLHAPLPALEPGAPPPQRAAPAAASTLRLALLDATALRAGPAGIAALAEVIASHLQAADLLALSQVRDDSGSSDDGVVTAAATLDALVAAIAQHDGPAYQYRQIDPLDGQDTTSPGDNARLVFLFRPDRGLAFVDRPGGDATTPVEVAPGALQLTLSPGRVAPQDPAFNGQPRPLAAELRFQERTIIVIAARLIGSSDDDALFGRAQPPLQPSREWRTEQIQPIADLVTRLLARDPAAMVVVLADVQDAEFSPALAPFEHAGLVNLTGLLPLPVRYTAIVQGNAIAYHQVLVSPGVLAGANVRPAIVHLGAEYAGGPVAYDPVLADLRIPPLIPGVFLPLALR